MGGNDEVSLIEILSLLPDGADEVLLYHIHGNYDDDKEMINDD